jgi:hypothetical protein
VFSGRVTILLDSELKESGTRTLKYFLPREVEPVSWEL